MARYTVVQLLQTREDVGEGEEYESLDVALVPCEDSRAVCRAILAVRVPDGGDWRVFEDVGGRMRSRAVVFKLDGKVPYDVEIS